MAVTIDVKTLLKSTEELKRWFDKLTPKLKRVAGEAAADYLIGDGRRGLRHYPPYKLVRRRVAYPEVKGWFSERQRRYVMARIREGTIDPGYPHRTGRYQRGWQKRQEGRSAFVVFNSLWYAKYVGGDEEQARQPRKVGWRKAGEIAQSNFDGMVRAAESAVEKVIRESGGFYR